MIKSLNKTTVIFLFLIVIAGVVALKNVYASEATQNRVDDLPPTVDQIVDNYIAAIGGYEKIKAINNLVYSKGTYEEGDFKTDGTAAMSLGRPYYKLVGDKSDPSNFAGGFLEGYDGSAWEWWGGQGFLIRTDGPPSEAIRHYAGVESPWVDYKQKGSTVELLGEVMIGDKPVYALLLTRRDGYVEQFYFDKETFLLAAVGAASSIHAFGDDVDQITYMADYKSVGGILIPHRFETREVLSGKLFYSMTWGMIEANKDLPADWFSPPAVERTLENRFIEHLYEQRGDVGSVMWTYHEFRLAYPDIDTSNLVNIAGYQILKMLKIETAITLLAQNVADYPNVASVRFGLGRAFERAKRYDEARKEFEAALAIDPNYERAQSSLNALPAQ